jgi:hypothetical protein
LTFPSIDDLIGDVFGNNSCGNGIAAADLDPNNNNHNSHNKGNKGKKDKSQQKPKCTIYKYSKKGKGPLYEATISKGTPTFIQYRNNEIRVLESIEESNRILRPPDSEEYPYEPYEFADIHELEAYVERARGECIASLYEKARSIVSKYNDQDPHKRILITTDVVWSYFQDKFSTTHYTAPIGGNGSGKSTIGDTFEAIGYRPVNMTDPTGANVFRALGTVEPGQCTIIADEAEKIDESPDIMSVLKSGYHIIRRVARTNTNAWKQEFFWPYSFKLIISERSPHQSNAKGILDRMLMFNAYPGDPQYDIKEVLNPAGDKKRQKLLDELIDFRKLMLIYRLIHFTDPIPDIDIGLKGRDKELCKPNIQLFYNTTVQKEIEKSLQIFIDAKNQRKESSIEGALYPIIANLISENGNEISTGMLWESIKNVVDGYSDERKPNEYQTSEYGIIYRNTITNIICDKFGAKRKHREKGNYLIFNPEKVAKAGKIYNSKISIQTKLIQDRPENTEGSEGSTGLTVKSQKNNDNKNTENREKSNENIQDIAHNITNNLQEKEDRKLGSSPEPPAPSVPSGASKEQSTLRCYYCGNGNFNGHGNRNGKSSNSKKSIEFEPYDIKEYESHMATRHFKKPAYPTRSDMKRYGLTPQGKSWEV